MAIQEVNGVRLGVESFGDPKHSLILCVGGTTMLSWPDQLCEKLAAFNKHVVRYDLRDCGESTTVNPMVPSYNLRDLAKDAMALARSLDERPAHLAGIGVGGMIAQVAALDFPDSFSTLTLYGTRPVAPGPVDDDLPDHDQPIMRILFSSALPDWTDRKAVAEHAAAGALVLGDDPDQARELAARIWDRTAENTPPAHMANQMGIVFSKIDCSPRWRERLGTLKQPTLVVHGGKDPFFPVGNGKAIAREIPDAQLLVLENASTAIPSDHTDRIAVAMMEREIS